MELTVPQLPCRLTNSLRLLYNYCMEKSQLRKEMVAKRDAVPSGVRKAKSASILERLKNLEIFSEAYTVMFYVGFRSEVETHKLIKEVLKTERRVAVPLVYKDRLAVKQISDFKQLKPGAMGILEPGSKQPAVPLEEINVVIVPGVAFDKRHYRLGYGGGYYDRFLSREADAHFTSIGLAFEEQIVDELPVGAHDQKVDFIVTDRRII